MNRWLTWVWLPLHVLAATSAAQWPPPPGVLDIALGYRGREYPLVVAGRPDPRAATFEREFMARARDAFEQVWRADYEGSRLFQACRRIADPGFRTQLLRITSLDTSRVPRIGLGLLLEDTVSFSSGRYGGGYPDWMAEQEDPLAGRGTRQWPVTFRTNVERGAGPLAEGQEDGPRAIVLLGEEEDAGGALESTLLHEFGHSVDMSQLEDGDYGLDGEHHFEEILTPGAAMMEGWADFVAREGLRAWGRPGVEDPCPGQPLLSLLVETDMSGTYLELGPDELRAEYFLFGNEASIAGVLSEIAALAPGRAAVDAAFVETNGLEGRMTSDFLGAYLARNAAQRGAVERILRRWARGNGPEATYAALLAGRAPAGVVPHRALLTRTMPVGGFLPLDSTLSAAVGSLVGCGALGTHGVLGGVVPVLALPEARPPEVPPPGLLGM